MFINFTARKDNGDFFVTSSEAEMEKYPELTEFDLRLYMLGMANDYFAKGWNIELTQED
mgnify:CR=1 FL=1